LLMWVTLVIDFCQELDLYYDLDAYISFLLQRHTYPLHKVSGVMTERMYFCRGCKALHMQDEQLLETCYAYSAVLLNVC
ncbi:hypothetical protein STEG23_013010, partial [Scotinomys teguina]